MKQKGLNGSTAYEYFVLKAQKIALSHGYEVINWCVIPSLQSYSLLTSPIVKHYILIFVFFCREETFNHFGNKLDKKTVVHNW